MSKQAPASQPADNGGAPANPADGDAAGKAANPADGIAAGKAAKPAKAPKQYKITFHGEGGDVEIAHNFKLNVYKRNVETTIDEHYLGVIKDAVVHTQVKGEDGKMKAVTIPQYNYTVEAL